MAEKQEIEVKKPSEVVKHAAPRQGEAATAVHRAPWPLITIGIVGTVVVMAIIFAGWWFIVSHNGQASSMNGRQFGRMSAGSGMMNRSDDGTNERNFGGGSGGRRGAMSAAARGVVTSVSGDTIIVSGNGKKVTVQKTSSTVISGDKTTIAENDSVTVVGTTASDGTVTATQIVIRNMATSGADVAPGV